MKPVKFEECNVVLAEDQPEYLQLPALLDKSEEGEIVYCMKLSFLERLQVLFTGRVWGSVLTFHKPLQPVFSTVFKDDLIPSKINIIRRLHLFLSDIRERIEDAQYRRSAGDDFPGSSFN